MTLYFLPRDNFIFPGLQVISRRHMQFGEFLEIIKDKDFKACQTTIHFSVILLDYSYFEPLLVAVSHDNLSF